MEIIKHPKKSTWNELLKRPTQTFENIENTVNEIFNDIQRHGDSSVMKYTEMFDGVSLYSLLVSKEDIKFALERVSKELKQAIQTAKANIEQFHLAQKIPNIEVETMPGVSCWQEKRPIQKVGLYIPGGTAPLFSSVLMLAVPAQIAGCKDIVLCSPPNKNGQIADEILFTAQLCGVTKIIKAGGIQAIAALTFGTASVPQVYKIFGPGNQYVTVAKQLATNHGVAIDMPAGPSELLVVADDSAKASYVASDLLSQAEHGSDSQVILISTSESLIESVLKEIKGQIAVLPRLEMAQKAIENSKLILVDSKETALEIINVYAPEHFIVCMEDENYFIENIANAGSVFIGNYTPESAGDYASGTNHTLPTNGFSKAYSGVNLDSFNKSITFQKISAAGIKDLGKTIELMAEAEGLQAHKNAVSIRLKDL
ncbi:MAG: histidinol dehydrogenase [Bacteroidota bacterium]